MILTGEAIKKEIEAGSINIYPFNVNQINPNSYNYRLGFMLKIPSFEDAKSSVNFVPIKIPDEGYVLQPGRMYLGSTYESIGSSKYAMSLIGRSSILGKCPSGSLWAKSVFIRENIKDQTDQDRH